MLLPFARPRTLQTLRRPPRQQLLQLHAPEHLCQLHAPAIYMLLPALKPPKRFQPSRRPPRQQLLQLHAAAICFSGGSRLPFARPHQTPQTLPTLPQASKATTLTATCPCHLFFRGFKTAVCPPSNPLKPPKRFRRPPRQQLLQLHAPEHLAGLASAGLQGNNSYSYMPLNTSQASKATTLTATSFARPQTLQTLRRSPRQQLLQLHAPEHLCQLHAPAIYMLLPFARPQTLQTLRRPPRQQLLQLHAPEHLCQLHAPAIYMLLPALKPPKRFQPSRRPPRQQLLQLHAAAICFSGGSRLPFARPHQTPQTLPTLPQASKATTLTATCPCHLFFRGFKTAVCPPSNPLKPPKRFRRPPRQQLLQLHAPEHLAGLVCPASNPPKRQQLLQLHAAAICFSGGSRLPFARPHQTPQTLPTLPQASKATTLTATCPCHLFFKGFKTAVCPPSNPLKPPKRFRRPPRQQLLQLHAPEHLAGLQGNNSYSYMPLNTSVSCMPQPSTCSCRLPGLKPSKLSAGLQGNNSYSYMPLNTCVSYMPQPSTCSCPPSNPPNASNPPAGLQGNNSYSYMPLPSVFQEVQDCRLPALKPPKHFQRFRRPPRQQLLQLYMPLPSVFQGVQDCRLPGVKPPKRFQTLPQASKATTLTATCPCHLFFRRFKTAVCLPSNPPNASNLPAGLQGNNSYSYTCLCHLFFRGFKTAVCPASNPPNASKRFRRPPRQQLLQLHAPAICFSGGSRLPFARPQTPQTLPTFPQASKATTLTATCRCHLFFRRFKTAVCPPSSNPRNVSNPPAGLQGNNSYSYMPLPSVFQGVQDCRLPALKPPKTPQTLPQASKATTLTATCP